ncbi:MULTISPECIES: hypothetical protein [Neobacillus]|nr:MULTISPECIES: hypothetical protein [Neobacillus]
MSTYENRNHSIANVAINTDKDVIDSIIDDQDIKIANITRD